MTRAVRPSWWSAPAFRPGAAATLAAIIVLVVGLRAIEPLPVGVMYDDGMYVILAKSLATGHGYRWLNVPGAPPATHFPPGYPAVLSLIWRVFPSFPANVLAFKIFNAVILAVAAWSLVLFAQRRLRFSPAAAALIAIAGCAAIPTLVLSTLVMSETLFLAMLCLLLPFADRVAAGAGEGSESTGANWWEPWVLGAFVAALTMVRTHGVALAAAIALALAIQRRWRALASFALAFVACVAPWQIWQSVHQGGVPAAMRGSYESYGGWLAHGFGVSGVALAARTLARTSTELFADLVVMAGAGLPLAARAIAACGALSLFGLGMARLGRTSIVTFLFMIVYLATVLVWPFTPSRFVWGIWPLVTLVTALGIAGVWRWRPRVRSVQLARVACGVAVALVCWGYATYTARGYRGRWWSSIPRQAGAITRPLVRWTLQHTAPGAVVASNAEPVVYLYTGRRSVPVTSLSIDEYFTPATVVSRASVLRSILHAYPVDAVAVMANDAVDAAARTLAQGPAPSLVLRDSIPNGVIFSPAPVLR